MRFQVTRASRINLHGFCAGCLYALCICRCLDITFDHANINLPSDPSDNVRSSKVVFPAPGEKLMILSVQNTASVQRLLDLLGNGFVAARMCCAIVTLGTIPAPDSYKTSISISSTWNSVPEMISLTPFLADRTLSDKVCDGKLLITVLTSCSMRHAVNYELRSLQYRVCGRHHRKSKKSTRRFFIPLALP